MTEAGSPLFRRLRAAEEIAGEVGALLMESFRAGVAAEAKQAGIVTELDRRAEATISRRLLEAFPEDGLVAEEGTARERPGKWRWVVDPLDGTTNYVRGLPMFTVSLACVDAGGPAVGVVHAPALGDTFRAVRGEGAWSDGGRLAPTGAVALGDAVFLLNKAYHPAGRLWEVAGPLAARVRAFRVLGCVSLDLALVASGRADGLVLLPTDEWDVAAGTLLLSESGAAWQPLPGEQEGRRGVLAATPAVFAEARGLLGGAAAPG